MISLCDIMTTLNGVNLGALGAYFIDNKYNTNGITVGFELERDYEHFLVFCDDYWIFMHD